MRSGTTNTPNVRRSVRRTCRILTVCCGLVMLPACRATGARPSINAAYKNADVDEWVKRFEGESREVYSNRAAIANSVGLQLGMAVADVGAGTGFFTMLFANAVGRNGKVFAVDVTPEFLELIRKRAGEHHLTNIETIRCSQDSADLMPDSIDAAFICDTYHHFEHPAGTMASIHEALRPGGSLIIVDFDRVRRKSRKWILKHVRASRETVISEIEAAGFSLTPDQPNDDFLKDNYIIRFRKTELDAVELNNAAPAKRP